MNNFAPLTYKTPVMRTIMAAGVILVALMLGSAVMYQINGKVFGFGMILIVLLPCLVLSRSGAILEQDSVIIRQGLGKKKFLFNEAKFFYGRKTGFAALLQSLSLQANFFRIQQTGKREVVLPLNITNQDFEALVMTMRERGASVETA